jgi:hypothetical protein
MPVYRPAEYVLQSVNYVAANGRSLPAILLYAVDDLGYCQFATEAWGHYDGFGYYSTAAIHLEHLRPADGKPLGTRDESRKIREPLFGVQPTGTPKKPQTSPVPPAPPLQAKPAVSRPKAPKNLRDLVRKVSTEHQGLNGKEKPLWKASDSETLKKYWPAREIGGLCLRDYLSSTIGCGLGAI